MQFLSYTAFFLFLVANSFAQSPEELHCEHEKTIETTHRRSSHKISASSHFSLSPDSVIVKSYYDFKIIHIVDNQGLKLNDVIRIQFPPLWLAPQDTNLYEFNYVSVYTSRFDSLLIFDFSTSPAFPLTGIKTLHSFTSFFKLLNYELFPGDTLFFKYGGKQKGGNGQSTSYLAGKDYFYADISYAQGNYSELSKFSIHEYPAPPAKIRVTSFSNPQINSSTPLKIVVTDKYNNPVINYAGVIDFSNLDGVTLLPSSYVFQPADSGRKIFYINFSDTLIHRIRVKDQNNLTGISNPVIAKQAGELKIWWGDMHTHSIFSNHGTGTPKQLFDYGKNITGLDFLIYSEHSYIKDSLYNEGIKVSNLYNKNYEFVTLNGYEWSTSVEHKVVFFKDINPPIFRDSSVSRMFLSVAANGGSVVAAHPTSTLYYTKWSSHNPAIQRNSEITGYGGARYELPNPSTPGSSVQEALSKNLIFGFVGGSDNHHSRPGKNMSNFVTQSEVGITAVFAPELTREKLYESINLRANYATTGARILLDFNINNTPMGRIIYSNKKIPVLTGTVYGQDTLKKIEVIKNNSVLALFYPAMRDFNFTLSDSNFSNDNYYYVRITQNDGHMAWSSPIWVTSSGMNSEDEFCPNEKCIEIFPNPNGKNFYLKCDFNSYGLSLNLTVYNLLGNNVFKEVLTQKEPGKFMRFVTLPEIPAGVYFLQIKYLDKTLVRKIVTVN